MDVSSRIKQLRESAGLSKNKLASMSGISQAYISMLEAGTKQPTVEKLSAICNALGITLSDFFADTRDAEPLPAELRKMLNVAYRLNPEQRELLLKVMEEWANYNNPNKK